MTTTKNEAFELKFQLYPLNAFCVLIFKMGDLLREQSSLNIGLSNISEELSIRRKASRRARICAHIEEAKKELKEDREKCMKEFREEVRIFEFFCMTRAFHINSLRSVIIQLGRYCNPLLSFPSPGFHPNFQMDSCHFLIIFPQNQTIMHVRLCYYLNLCMLSLLKPCEVGMNESLKADLCVFGRLKKALFVS